MSAQLNLPDRLDNGAASDLIAAFQAHQGVPLVINAQAVAHLGTLSAQVLVSAMRSWSQAKKTLIFKNISLPLQTAWVDLGLSHHPLPTQDGASE